MDSTDGETLTVVSGRGSEVKNLSRSSEGETSRLAALVRADFFAKSTLVNIQNTQREGKSLLLAMVLI